MMQIEKIRVPEEYRSFIREVTYQKIGDYHPEIVWTKKSGNMVELAIEYLFESDTPVDDWNIRILPAFNPDFYWTPHLTPDEDSVIDMHVFRTPALILGNEKFVLSTIPNVEKMRNNHKYRYYMDLDARTDTLMFGVTETEVYQHVLYRKIPGAVLPEGRFRFTVIFIMRDDSNAVADPFRDVLAYFWSTYGAGQCKILPRYDKLMTYVDRTYKWAFDQWKDKVWQEFEIDGRKVGAPAFIVTVFQSPNYPEEHSIREELSIWNQAWFSSLRSAMGLYRYASMKQDPELESKALMTKELALSFPQTNGLFDAVVAAPNRNVEIDGKVYVKSGSWDDHYFGNSNRNPYTSGIKDSPYHILDMSWTALHMLRWYSELEPDERLLKYAEGYADRLMRLQDDEGFFPAWIDKGTDEICDCLKHSPESAVSSTFFMKLYEMTSREDYLASALKSIDAVVRECLYSGRWEDFETYWSCCRYGSETLVGKKIERNGVYKQCNFSMFFTAEALLAAYKLTGDRSYLEKGQRCLDEMLMSQSSFQPKDMPIPVIGGFGVMNCDGELNDSRQSLFAELIILYGRELENEEYIQRGYAALQASFTMMYCPENIEVMKMWNKKWPFLKEEDYGFMMENYGHNGHVDRNGEGMGEFTIYDWGNGAASEAYMRIEAHNGNPASCKNGNPASYHHGNPDSYQSWS